MPKYVIWICSIVIRFSLKMMGEHGKEKGGENDLLQMADPPNLLLYGGKMGPT